MNVNGEIKSLTAKIEMQQGQFRFVGDEQIKKENEVILVEFKAKAQKGKEAILELIEVLRKCMKYLVGE